MEIARTFPFQLLPEFCRRGLLIGVCSLHLQGIDVSFAQTAGSFGPCLERSLEFIPAGLALRERSGSPRPEIAVLAQDRPAIHSFALSPDGEIVPLGSTGLSAPQRAIVAADIDGDGQPELITLSSGGSEVSILKRKGDTYEQQVIPVEVKAQRLAIADIDNNGRKDILLFGKSMTGVLPLLGGKRGTFSPGPLLFPEISVSDLKTIDLNGDGITDVILLNWLSNQLVLFYGISRGIFSEQVTIPLDGEPADLALSELPRRHTIRVAVTLPAERKIEILDGLVAGEFVTRDAVACPGRPAGVQFAQINDDGIPDLVTSTEKGMAVALAESGKDYATPVLFGLGSAGRSWVVGDVDGDRRADLVLADRQGKRLVAVGNAQRSGTYPWPETYAVGNSPRGIAILDCNRDGRNDVAVVNSGSSSISVLLNLGGGKFLGQQSISLPDAPASVTVAASGPARGRVLVTSHPTEDRIAVVDLNRDLGRSVKFSVPTSAQPYALYASNSRESSDLEILVRSRNPRDGSVSLSLFEQLSGRQFLERSLQANLPNRITALTVADFLEKGLYDMVFATADKRERTTSIFLASGSTSFDFKTVKRLYEFSDSTWSTRSIVSGFLDGDEHKDFLIVLGPPRNQFAIGYGQGNGTFRDSLAWVDDVHPAQDDEIVLRDINGDGRVDIAYLDAERRAVMVLYGTGRRQFAAPVEVCPAPGVSSFAIGTLRSSSSNDLVLSSTTKGTVSVIFAPFRR